MTMYGMCPFIHRMAPNMYLYIIECRDVLKFNIFIKSWVEYRFHIVWKLGRRCCVEQDTHHAKNWRILSICYSWVSSTNIKSMAELGSLRWLILVGSRCPPKKKKDTWQDPKIKLIWSTVTHTSNGTWLRRLLLVQKWYFGKASDSSRMIQDNLKPSMCSKDLSLVWIKIYCS